MPQAKVAQHAVGDVAAPSARDAQVHDQVDRLAGRVHAIPVGGRGARSGVVAEAAYRLFEIAFASVGLIIGLPVMLATAIVVRLDSPGPALFFAPRVGRSDKVRGSDLEGRADLIPPPGGFEPGALYYAPRPLKLIKFRTMFHDARTRYPEFFHSEYARENFRSTYAHIPNDPRITRAGRLLRKLSVDELPNLWSVLTGEMRLVGPRPEAPEVVPHYTAEEMLKFTCTPGVTGLAQVSGRGLLNWGDTLALDIEYVRTRSVALDLKILLLTIKRVVARHGAL